MYDYQCGKFEGRLSIMRESAKNEIIEEVYLDHFWVKERIEHPGDLI